MKQSLSSPKIMEKINGQIYIRLKLDRHHNTKQSKVHSANSMSHSDSWTSQKKVPMCLICVQKCVSTISPELLCWARWQIQPQLLLEGPEPEPGQQQEPVPGRGQPEPVAHHPAAAGPTAVLSAALQEPGSKTMHKILITKEVD